MMRRAATALFCMMLTSPVLARDPDGRYLHSPLRDWFNGLKSEMGLCCSVADGHAIADPDWKSENGHYLVRIDGQWIVVPDGAVLKVPNLSGKTMAWVIRALDQNDNPRVIIRCFILGTMT